MRFRKKPEPVLVRTISKREAFLNIYSDGSTRCACPYACVAVHEGCEFDDIKRGQP
jgi:hypothetical protein